MADRLSTFAVGQTVKLQDGRLATVRYLGATHFAAGDWVGVELDTATGKNNGEVQGERYFDCKPLYGMFLRPAAIKAHTPPTSRMNGGPNGKAVGVGAGAGASKRQSLVGQAAKRHSITASSPSFQARPGQRSSVSGSPVKSPTKTTSPTFSSGNSTPGSRTPVQPSRVTSNRTSMGPPARPAASHAQRASVTVSATAARGTHARPMNPRLGPGGRKQSAASVGSLASEGSAQNSQDEGKASKPRSPLSSGTSETPSQPLSPVLSRASATPRPVTSPGAPPSPEPSPTLTQRTIHTMSMTAAGTREIEELKKKLRLIEGKRKDDREKLKTLERLQVERDKFEGIIQKLQAKLQPQHQEATELRRLLKESNAKIDQIEPEQSQQELALEMATLDREMAEEKAEVLRAELEALKQRAEELQLEVEVLRAENQELDHGADPEEKSSHGWIHMERENGRLREALLRLRDLTQQSEAELRDQMASLEEDSNELGSIKERYESTREKLLLSEAGVDDLKQQLETALGAEGMIEELTQKNMSLSDRIEELLAVNQDLEGLKEINDEIELDHVEYEKQLEQEIDHKESLLHRQERQLKEQGGVIEEYDYTISRYKELVRTLQGELDDSRASQQITDAEAGESTTRSRVMIDLNMKLQASARKTQAKTIELELRRLEAQEASELLAIVQRFLPEAYLRERDSVSALLRFRRVAFKAHLLHELVQDRVSGTVLTGREDDIFAACQVLDRLAWTSAMCQRFVKSISSCSIDRFTRFAGTLYELEPVERALNGWIDGMRSDELREKQCASELQRTLALMSHLAEIHLSDDLESYADSIHMRVVLVQSRMENAASAMSHIKDMVQSRVVPQDNDDDQLDRRFARQAEAFISQARSARVVVGKTIRSLEELRDRSLSLPSDTSDAFERCEQSSQELMDFSFELGSSLFTLISEEGRATLPTYPEVQETIRATTSAILHVEENDFFSSFTSRLQALNSQVHDLNGLASDIRTAVEFERPMAPWVIRSEEMKAATAKSANTEEEVKRLRDELHERATQIALRDKTREELAVKIELLESRMSDASKNNVRLEELQAAVKTGREREKDLVDALDGQLKELQALAFERDRLKKMANSRSATEDPAAPNTAFAGSTPSAATVSEMEALTAEVATLQSAVRYLREESRLLRHKSDAATAPLLAHPINPAKSARQQALGLAKAEQLSVLKTMMNRVAPVTLDAVFSDAKPGGGAPAGSAWRPKSQTAGWRLVVHKDAALDLSRWCDDVLADARAVRPRSAKASKAGLSTWKATTAPTTGVTALGAVG